MGSYTSSSRSASVCGRSASTARPYTTGLALSRAGGIVGGGGAGEVRLRGLVASTGCCVGGFGPCTRCVKSRNKRKRAHETTGEEENERADAGAEVMEVVRVLTKKQVCSNPLRPALFDAARNGGAAVRRCGGARKAERCRRSRRRSPDPRNLPGGLARSLGVKVRTTTQVRNRPLPTSQELHSVFSRFFFSLRLSRKKKLNAGRFDFRFR
ncbi:MAG: hypothetical protein BJ554DRAFT_5714 [Olpidium bornovanus]|uniref:Uncharacterized protein n=1 Tax=Olpidium bornovanus TaxID=278681 RepID=A0A8H8A2B9_9FUNG|nr:MAG: hypothetical protein BJ554DRAFT_5714 [Olpidium bornovanus]